MADPCSTSGGFFAVDEQRKHAYRYLLYIAMLDIRAVQWLGWRSWRAWSPLYWRREGRRVRYAGAIADWLHNLARYSSNYNFQGFKEEWFWRDFERLRSEFPEFGLEYYREEFERHANPPPDSQVTHPSPPPDGERT
jgi:hypothetical protein